jgi:flagellar capping protein FliD
MRPSQQQRLAGLAARIREHTVATGTFDARTAEIIETLAELASEIASIDSHVEQSIQKLEAQYGIRPS